MKKSNFLSLILISILIVSVLAFSKAICVDEDAGSDILCDINGYFRYKELFASILTNPEFFCGHGDCVISNKPIMTFLERQEKSPPFNSLIFVTV